MKIFLLVNESMGKRIFNMLINENIKLIGIFSDKKSKDYNFYKKKSKDLKFKLFYDLKNQYKKVKEHLRNEHIDLMINIFSYSKIPNELINLTKIGAFNLHPGRLPQFAGLNPISWSLVNGEKKHYITLHWMTNRIDSGPIVLSKSFKIYEKDSAINVMERSIKTGEKIIFQFIKKLENNNKKIPKISQNLKKRKYNSNQIPNSGFIDWSTKASQIYNFVRAFDYKPYNSFWLEPKTINKKKIYYIIKVKKTKIKCNVNPGNIIFYKKKYMYVSTLDFWIAILKIKYKNKYINPIQFFNNEDRFKIINE